MKIISFEINSNGDISLVSDALFTGLVLSYNKKLKDTYTLSNLNTKNIIITKSNLNLNTLKNNYFSLELEDALNNKIKGALYEIDLINDLESKIYDGKNFKSELDNLNFYSNVIQNLTEREAHLEANELFFQFLNYLSKEFYANNIIQVIDRQE